MSVGIREVRRKRFGRFGSNLTLTIPPSSTKISKTLVNSSN